VTAAEKTPTTHVLMIIDMSGSMSATGVADWIRNTEGAADEDVPQ